MTCLLACFLHFFLSFWFPLSPVIHYVVQSYAPLPRFLDEFLGSFLRAGEFVDVVLEADCAVGKDVERLWMALEEFDELEDARADD